MVIRAMTGDLLRQDDVDAIVNTVNCVAVMRVLLCNSSRERLTRARRGPRAAHSVLPLAPFPAAPFALVRPSERIRFMVALKKSSPGRA